MYKWIYQVNLDSVYGGPERPVYELARVKMDERNKYELLVQVHFVNGWTSAMFISAPFLVRTKNKNDDGESGMNT